MAAATARRLVAGDSPRRPPTTSTPSPAARRGTAGNTGDSGGRPPRHCCRHPQASRSTRSGNLYIADTTNNRDPIRGGRELLVVLSLGTLLDDRQRRLHHRRQLEWHGGQHRRQWRGHLGTAVGPEASHSTPRATSTSPTRRTTGSSSWRPRPARRLVAGDSPR